MSEHVPWVWYNEEKAQGIPLWMVQHWHTISVYRHHYISGAADLYYDSTVLSSPQALS